MPTATAPKTPTVETLAAEVSAQFVRDKRTSNGEEFIKLADGAPKWMNELCRAAHGDMMPDDWRYEFIEDAVTQLENGDDDPRDLDSAYPYTADRLNWLASTLTRHAYCDEAANEFGGDGLVPVLDLIGWGMSHEMRETFDLVRTFLEDRVTELEEEAEEAAAEAEEGGDDE